MSARLRSVRLPGRLDQPIIFGKHSIEQSADARIVVIDREIVIRLTPIEYRIFSHLLSRPHTLICIDELAAMALQTKNHQPDPQIAQNIDRHISALRSKLRYSGLRILRVVSNGWLLADEEREEDNEQTRSHRAIG